MKKQITLLSTLIMGAGLSYGQSAINQNLPTAKSAKKKAQLQTDLSVIEHAKGALGGTLVNKAPGDTAWVDHFSNASLWTNTGAGSDPTKNGWSIGNSVNVSWAFSSGTNMGTSGNFARFVNGDPTDNNPPVLSSAYTFEYTNTINLTGIAAPFLEFEQYGARFITKQEVQISTDGGTTWQTAASNSDIPPLTGSGGSPYAKPMTRRFSIGGITSANPANVKIRLSWDGDMNGGSMSYVEYGWFVDNIRIMEGYPNNLSLLYPYALTGTMGIYYTQFPKTQTGGANAKTQFGAITKNTGSNSQDAVLNVKESATSYNGLSAAPTTLAPYTMDSVEILMAGGYTIPATVGAYTFNYKVKSNNNTLADTLDDVATMPYKVTDTVMACDGYNGSSSSFTNYFLGWASTTGDAAIGSYFEIFNNANLSFVDVGIAAEDTSIGNTLNTQIWKYNTGTSQFEFLTASLDHIITAADTGKLVRTQYYPAVNLTAGDQLVVMAGFLDGSPVAIAFAGSVPRYQVVGLASGSLTGLAPNGGDTLNNDAPVVRLDFGIDYTGIKEYSATPNFKVFSVENGLKVDLSSTELKDGIIRVYGMDGRTITSKALTSYSMNTVDVNVPTGIYFYTISNNDQSYKGKVFIK